MYYLGIDLGGTNVAAGIVDEEMNLVYKTSIPTEAAKGPEHVINRIVEAAKAAMDGYRITEKEIKSIGIGTPGAVAPKTGVVTYAANLGFKHTPLAKRIGEQFPGIPVSVENDANAAAWAEAKCGAAKGTTDSITITLGTGVGGGMIINGSLYSGFNGMGGELGHMVITENGRPCSCGRKGCWEAYASVTGLINTTKEHMNANPDSLMWKIAGSLDRVNGLTSFDAMRKGDEEAKKVVAEYLDSVACGIASICNMLQPEVLCIGGGISREGETLLGPIKEYVMKEIFSRYGDTQTQLKIAQLGNDAGIIGAALLGA